MDKLDILDIFLVMLSNMIRVLAFIIVIALLITNSYKKKYKHKIKYICGSITCTDYTNEYREENNCVIYSDNQESIKRCGNYTIILNNK